MFPSCTAGLGPFKPRSEKSGSPKNVCLTLNPKPSHIIYMSMYISLYGYIYMYIYIHLDWRKKRYWPWHHQIVPAKIHQNPPLLSPQLAGAIGEARHHDGLVFFQRRRLDPEAPAAAEVVVVGPGPPMMAAVAVVLRWTKNDSGTLKSAFLQCEAPQWCYSVNKSPSNYSYLRTINHSYWSYVHQLSYLGGLTWNLHFWIPVAGCGVASRSHPSTMTGKAPCHENMSAVPYAPNNGKINGCFNG